MTKTYREETEAILNRIRPIRSKAMFGGVALYSDEQLFAILDDDRIWFKFDDATRPDYESRGCEQWRPSPGAPPMGYFELPTGVLANSEELSVWIDKAIGAAERKSAAKSKKKKGS